MAGNQNDGDGGNEQPKAKTSPEAGVAATKDRTDTTDRQSPTDRVSTDAFNKTFNAQDLSTLGSFTAQSNLETVRTNLATAGLRNDGTIDLDPKRAYEAALAGKGGLPDIGTPPSDRMSAPGGNADTAIARSFRGSQFEAPEGYKPDTRPTDHQIDLPKEKPAGMDDTQWAKMQEEVRKLNEQLTDEAIARNGITPNQRDDIERGVEQMLNGKNADGSDRRPPLDPNEVTKVLENTNRMLGADDATLAQRGFTAKDRNMAVSAMIDDVANPEHLNQGLNQTCNVTAEARVEMMTHPGAQTNRIADMFTNTDMKDENGNFVKIGDQKVYYDANSVKGGREAQYAEDYRGANARDAYSQALNHLYVNAISQPQGYYYTDGDPGSNGDTGERVHKGGFNKPELADENGRKYDAGDFFNGEAVQRLSNKLGNGTLAVNFNRFGIGQSEPNPGATDVGGTSGISIDEAWEKNGGKPMVVAVDTNSKLFNPQAGDGGVTPGGGHVVTVTDRRENPPGSGHYEYYMMNQWGSNPPGKNKWVSSEELQAAMNPQEGSKTNAPAGYQQPNGGPGERLPAPGQRPSGGDGGDGGGGGGRGGQPREGDSPYSAPKGGGVQTREDRSDLFKEQDERWKKMSEEQRHKEQEEENKRQAEIRRKALLEYDIYNPESPNYIYKNGRPKDRTGG